MVKAIYLLTLVGTMVMASHVTPDRWTFRTKAPEKPYATGLIPHDKSYTDSRFPPPMLNNPPKPETKTPPAE